MQYLKELIKQGFLVEPSAVNKLNKLSEKDFEFFVSKLKEENLFVVNDKLFNRYFKPEIKIIKDFKPKTKFSMQDYVKMLNERYDFLKKILIKKIELINLLSINKLGLGKVSVIGLVKDKEEKGDNFILTIEDITGEIQVVASRNLVEKINLDDVIAVSGNINNKIFFAERILFPDITLKEANCTSIPIKIAFTEKEAKADYVITRKFMRDMVKNKNIKFSNLILLEISGVIILVAVDIDPLDILKKRFIHEQNNDFLINFVPDIVFNTKNVNTNYKGTSIIAEDNLVDLSNREITVL